ncbi:MAG TPA: 2-oxo acid dehydrogenase subunit E2 [Candidatus Binataceae bacterium]|nr:2-oxo acid dehydrogenase subunit E2 [Candidatus Binataceae bacterium]
MSIEITMPKLSDTMEEGKILRWLKHPGDEVHHGDAIAEVETDKADMVMEAFDEGVIDEIRLKEGESAKVGAVIAIMLAAGESRPKPGGQPAPAVQPDLQAHTNGGASVEPLQTGNGAEDSGAEAAPGASTPRGRVAPIRQARRRRASNDAGGETPAEASSSTAQGETVEIEAEDVGGDTQPQFHPAMSAVQSAAPTAIMAAPPRSAVVPMEPPSIPAHGDGTKFRASPLARRAAEEASIDLAQVPGTGPEGRVTKRDVDNFLREQQLFKFRRLIAPREGSPGTREELSKMRKTIAHRMAQSKREIPHFYVTIEVDMEEAVKLKNSLEATELFEEDITYNDIIVKATALALARYTRMNASYQDDGVIIYPNINIGMAVAVEDGLIVPVIHQCEQKTLPEISRAAHRLVSKAARGGFSGEDLSGATFTISNMGMLGVEHFAAVIVPPQAAILAVSAVKDKPVVRNGQVVVGKTMMLTVACDHRIIDGVIGARFLNELKRFLENPASLLV